jgi:diguanylate cyclase (GGDEF)-like protein
VNEQPKLEDVIREANKRLVEENTSYQELTWKLERALAEKERLAAQLREVNSQLEQLAYYDSLTGLVNRRRFYEVFPAEIARHSRSGRPVSLIMIDLDHFKLVNDTYGHPFGDVVLEAVASAMKQTFRTTDVKARIGGEEMCVLIPECDEETGRAVAERMRQNIEDLALKTPTRTVKVTASFGGCTWSGLVKDVAAISDISKRMMNCADEALYESKAEGRNCVTWREFPR